MENENNNSNRDLDTRLRELGFSNENNIEKKQFNLIEFIRNKDRSNNSNGNSSKDSNSSNNKPFIPLYVIGEQVNGINSLNRSIEDTINIEILGLRDDFFGKLKYTIKQAFSKNKDTAESLINQQGQKVSLLTKDLVTYTNSIDSRINNLENRYSEVTLNLLGSSRNFNKITQNLAEYDKIIPHVIHAFENAHDEEERIKYKNIGRNIRQKIFDLTNRLERDGGVKNFLEKEQDVLDGLTTICNAYSSTLKGVLTHAELMNQHIKVITPVYLDMIRSQHVNSSLDNEVKRLGEYVLNMNNILKTGANSMVERAKNTSFTHNLLTNMNVPVTQAVAGIEESTFNTLTKFEDRINSYSKDMKGGNN